MGDTGALQKSSMGNTGALQLQAEADDFRAAVLSSARNDSPFSGSPYAWPENTSDDASDASDTSDEEEYASDDSDEEDDASDGCGEEIIPDEVYAEQLCLQEALVGSASLNKGISCSLSLLNIEYDRGAAPTSDDDFRAAVLSSARNDDSDEEEDDASDGCDEEIIPDEVYAQQLCLQEALVGSASLNKGINCSLSLLKIEDDCGAAPTSDDDLRAAVLSSALNDNSFDGCGEEIIPDEVYAQQLCLQEALVGSASLNRGINCSLSTLKIDDDSDEQEDTSDDSDEEEDTSDDSEEDFRAAVLSSALNDNAFDGCGPYIIPDEVYAQQLCLQEALVGSASLNRGINCTLSTLKIDDDNEEEEDTFDRDEEKDTSSDDTSDDSDEEEEEDDVSDECGEEIISDEVYAEQLCLQEALMGAISLNRDINSSEDDDYVLVNTGDLESTGNIGALESMDNNTGAAPTSDDDLRAAVLLSACNDKPFAWPKETFDARGKEEEEDASDIGEEDDASEVKGDSSEDDDFILVNASDVE